jgi:3'-phosphoadenosine 5'-phosphosulfate sulfotransferase (PAPS reductase)/FAD synthetase
MKRPEINLFNINENNELVMGCKGPVGESYFEFTVPENYTPSSHMPNLSYPEWIKKIKLAAQHGEITKELAGKILHSLQRLPDLAERQKVCISFSNGKDSQVIFMLAAMRYERKDIMALFADTKDEWPETYEFQPRFEKWIGVPVKTIETVGIHKLLRERMPFWPKMGMRHCTKNLKLIPQRDDLDAEGYDQVRSVGVAKYRTTYGMDYLNKLERKAYLDSKPKALPIDVKHPAPLMLSGERWAESAKRSQLPYEEKNETIMRITQRPALEFYIEEVWSLIWWMKAPYNLVYHFVKRCACAGCPFASKHEIETLGEHHPHKLEEWVETEAVIGHPWRGIGFVNIHADLVRTNRLGKIANLKLLNGRRMDGLINLSQPLSKINVG